MTFGTVGMLHPSLAAMVDSINTIMSREALHLRFTAAAVSFMQQCVTFIFKQRINDMATIDSRLLNKFKRIHIIDSTSWDIHPRLRDILPGSGGAASSANCKVQLCYEYLHGTLSFFDIIPGKNSDKGYASKLPELIGQGDLLIADLGYFCLQSLKSIADSGAYFISRLLVGTTLYDEATLRLIDLRRVLEKSTGNAYQMDVVMGLQKKTQVRCRLICLRVGDDIAQTRRRKLNKNAAKKGRTVSQLNLFMSGWTLMVTNVPREWLPPEMVRPFYMLRWQIELLFKQLKSVLAIHKSMTGKEHRFRCELLGKLIVAILIHRIHADVNIRLWNTKRREISMDKLYKRIQERAFTLMRMLLTSFQKAMEYFTAELISLISNCRKLKQKSRLSSLQFLDNKISSQTVQDMALCDLT
jgi:Transposase DDE domain